MCLNNSVKPFYGISMAELANKVEQLEWESELREAEMDKLLEERKKILDTLSDNTSLPVTRVWKSLDILNHV